MLHVSTRGFAPTISFADALLAGLARDGGLYVPEHWPTFSPDEIAVLAGRSYAQVAEAILGKLIEGDIEAEALTGMIEDAYATFRHPATCPLVQIDDNLFLLELFHGPTLAFKDVAMQLLGRLMDHVLRLKGQRATVVGATSGDTGGAAIAALAGLEQVDVFILYPHGRVSDVQRRQMTTIDAPNVHTIALEGSFDDAQAIVKGLFNHHAFRDELHLAGVNSINWARIAAQIVYYFTAATSLGAPHRPVSFSVPTGNFGDIFAGYAAKRMGLPIDDLVIATNTNDILVRTLATGVYEAGDVTPTMSPSMDIQVSSNFERLLFEAMGREDRLVRHAMANFAQSRSFRVEASALDSIRSQFSAFCVSEAETAEEMRQTWAKAGILLDPHTAIGVRAARHAAKTSESPMVALATAHPAKFPAAVEAATGIHPPLPAHLSDLFDRKEQFTVLPNDQKTIEGFMRDRARVLKVAA